MIEQLTPNMALRLAERRQRRAEEAEEIATHNAALAIGRANKLTAEVVRLRRANAELLERLRADAGWPSQPLLPEVTR